MDTLSIEITNHLLRPDVVTLRIKGFIYANTLVQFDKVFQSVMAGSKKKMIFDLSETNYISSGGWSMLLVCLQRVKESGGDILLSGMKPEVHDAFELLEYNKVMRLFPNAEEALKEGFGTLGSKPVISPA